MVTGFACTAKGEAPLIEDVPIYLSDLSKYTTTVANSAFYAGKDKVLANMSFPCPAPLAPLQAFLCVSGSLFELQPKGNFRQLLLMPSLAIIAVSHCSWSQCRGAQQSAHSVCR